MPRPVHFEIHSADPGATVEFYSALFGWTFSRWGGLPYWLVGTGDGNPMTGVPDTDPGINGGLVVRQGPPPEMGQPVNAWVVTVEVPDARGYLDRALELGATVAVPLDAVPGVGWLAYITDPAGNLFGLMQPDEAVAVPDAPGE